MENIFQNEGFRNYFLSTNLSGWYKRGFFSDKLKPHRFALETFSGTARIADALCAAGIPTYPIDVVLHDHHDVLDPAVEQCITKWLKDGRILFLWLCMPCTTFSRARKWDGLGPGPLRDEQNLWGLSGLRRTDNKKLQIGNNLLLFTLRMMVLCESLHVPYVLENPTSSYAWYMPPLVKFSNGYNPLFCYLDFCQFGERWKKPTTLLYNFLDLSDLNRQCQSKHGICSRTSRPHVRLAGVDQAGVFMTLRAQPYPFPMVALVSKLVASTLRG